MNGLTRVFRAANNPDSNDYDQDQVLINWKNQYSFSPRPAVKYRVFFRTVKYQLMIASSSVVRAAFKL